MANKISKVQFKVWSQSRSRNKIQSKTSKNLESRTTSAKGFLTYRKTLTTSHHFPKSTVISRARHLVGPNSSCHPPALGKSSGNDGVKESDPLARINTNGRSLVSPSHQSPLPPRVSALIGVNKVDGVRSRMSTNLLPPRGLADNKPLTLRLLPSTSGQPKHIRSAHQCRCRTCEVAFMCGTLLRL